MAKKHSKTIKKLKKLVKSIKSIKKDNKKFRASTAAQKRVLIAKDVLASLRGRKIKPTCGVWLSTSTYAGDCTSKPLITGTDLKEEKQLSEVLKKLPNCRACAIGTMFNVSVQRFNKLKCGDLDEFYGRELSSILEGELAESLDEMSLLTEIRDKDAFKFLNRFFGDSQLIAIEMAFELGFGLSQPTESDLSADAEWDAILFGMKHKTARSRMKAIMENIVKNKGSFMPEKRKHNVSAIDGPEYLDGLLARRQTFVDRADVQSNDKN